MPSKDKVAKVQKVTQRRLTPKQEKFCRLVALSDKTPSQVAQEVYNVGSRAKSTDAFTIAANIATENLNKPYLKNRISELLDKAGLGLDKLAKKHNELLNSTKPQILDGEIVNVADNSVQMKALEVAYRLQGALDEKNTNIDVNLDIGQIVYVRQNPNSPDRLRSSTVSD